jgi:nitrous oxidase accessory protein
VVDPEGEVTTLTMAISRAAPGDTILIKAGTYREGNININKTLVIIGVGYPVFDGENKYEILTISANGVTVRGLKFIDTGTASMNDLAAVKVLNSKNVTIAGNQFVDAFFGVHFFKPQPSQSMKSAMGFICGNATGSPSLTTRSVAIATEFISSS